MNEGGSDPLSCEWNLYNFVMLRGLKVLFNPSVAEGFPIDE